MARRSSTTCSRMIRPPRPSSPRKRVRAGDRDAGRQRRSHPGRRRGRVHVRPTHGGDPANDLDFCPGVGGGARCPDSKPSRCAPGCEDRGTCNQELGRCDCPRGMGGDACELGQLERFEVPETRRHVPPLCYNDCSGRGECVEGFCRCLPGFSVPTAVYLEDVGVPRLAPDTPWRGHRPTPKVYVYHMPPGSTSTSTPASSIARSRFSFRRRVVRTIARRIPTTRISSSCVTPRLIAGHGGKALYLDAIKYVNETWPERTRRNGWRDHLFFFAGDWGPCDFSATARPRARRVAGRARQRHRVVALGSREAQEGVSRRWSLLLSREGRVASSHTE